MSEKTAPEPRGVRNTRLLLIFAMVAVAAAIGAAALLVTVVEHKQEARNPFFRVVEITDDIDDPAVWGQNFPLQFDLYRKTVDMVRTRFGGSEAVQRTPSQADPRSVVSYTDLNGLKRLRDQGSLKDGMLPKAKAIEDAIRGGVRRVHVISYKAQDSILAEVFTNEGTGTLIVQDTKALSAAEQQG